MQAGQRVRAPTKAFGAPTVPVSRESRLPVFRDTGVPVSQDDGWASGVRNPLAHQTLGESRDSISQYPGVPVYRGAGILGSQYPWVPVSQELAAHPKGRKKSRIRPGSKTTEPRGLGVVLSATSGELCGW